MSFYQRHLPHLQRDFRVHFLTFATYLRRPLPPWARSIVLTSCRFYEDRKYYLMAAVVMPDHVHLLLNPKVVDSAVVSIENITRSIKSYTAHAINRELNRQGTVWQEESFDHVVRRGNFSEKLDYVLQNPVRKSLVTLWRNYAWCYCHPDCLPPGKL